VKRNFVEILHELDARSRVIGLVVLLAEALFLAALAKLPSDDVIWALLVCTIVLLAGLAAVVLIEAKALGTRKEKSTSPISDDVELLDDQKDFYDRIASHYDERNTSYLLETHRAVIAEVSEFAAQQKTVEVLDIGCGTGRLIATHFFEQENLHWVGVDDSPGMLAQFRKNLENTKLNYEPTLGDIHSLERLSGRRFDLIVMSLVLTTLSELPDFAAIARLLNDGGRVIIADIDPVYSEVNPIYAVNIDGRQIGLRMVPRHPLDVVDLMADQGIKTIDTQTIHRSDGVRYAYVLVGERPSA